MSNIDFWGLNFYSNITVQGLRTVVYTGDIQANGHYSVQPEQMYNVLKEFATFNKPIFITENGLSSDSDSARRALLHSYLKVIHRAINEDGPRYTRLFSLDTS